MRNRFLRILTEWSLLVECHGLRPGYVLFVVTGNSRLRQGIVTTTDNGRLNRSGSDVPEGGIASGRYAQLPEPVITEPSVASAMFEYRFGGNGEPSGI